MGPASPSAYADREMIAAESETSLRFLVSGGIADHLPILQSSPLSEDRAVKNSDVSHYTGLLMSVSRMKDGYSFHLNGALLAVMGGHGGIGTENDYYGDRKPDHSVHLLPGGDLYINRSFPGIEGGGMLLGKSTPASIRSDALRTPANIPELFFTGVNANPMGLRFHVTGEEAGTMILTPYHLHSLNGNFLANNTDSHHQHRDLTAAIRRLDGAVQRILDKEGESGHGLIYLYEYEGFLFSTHYDINYFEETVSLIPDRNRRDRIDYSGLSFGYSGSSGIHGGSLWISVDRSAGHYRAANRDKKDRYEGRIDGYAIRSEMLYRYGSLRLSLFFFLPEPATVGRGSITREGEKSGYVLNGSGPATSPLLSGSLDYIPSPVPCPENELCDGLLYASDESGHRDHAALLRFRTSYGLENSLISFSAEAVRPLAYRMDGVRNPFKRTKIDGVEFSLMESTLDLYYGFEGFELLFEISSLHRFNRDNRMTEAGRSARITLSVDL